MDYTGGRVSDRPAGVPDMQRVCPKCQATFHGLLVCPQCGMQIPDGTKPAPPPAPPAPHHRPVSPPAAPQADRPHEFTAVTRFVVGLVLAQGFYYGARQLGQAVLLAQNQTDWWDSMPGLITVQALQAGALLIGGIIAGAGRARGLLPGAVLGLANASAILL